MATVRIHIPHGVQGGCSEDVSDAYDVLMAESQQDLYLPQRALAVGLMLEGADLLDGHSSLAHVVISGAERAREVALQRGNLGPVAPPRPWQGRERAGEGSGQVVNNAGSFLL